MYMISLLYELNQLWATSWILTVTLGISDLWPKLYHSLTRIVCSHFRGLPHVSLKWPNYCSFRFLTISLAQKWGLHICQLAIRNLYVCIGRCNFNVLWNPHSGHKTMLLRCRDVTLCRLHTSCKAVGTDSSRAFFVKSKIVEICSLQTTLYPIQSIKYISHRSYRYIARWWLATKSDRRLRTYDAGFWTAFKILAICQQFKIFSVHNFSTSTIVAKRSTRLIAYVFWFATSIKLVEICRIFISAFNIAFQT